MIERGAFLMGWRVGQLLRALLGIVINPDTPVQPEVPSGVLLSADGYTLKDLNGIYITAKEDA